MPDNPTISSRYGTYKERIQKSNYPSNADLVREIDISKDLLKGNVENKVFVHDELCMWRVVILSEHCLVQNYFPNHSGCQSDASPVFVFEKEEKFSHSYYETFQQMFQLPAKSPFERIASQTTLPSELRYVTFGAGIVGGKCIMLPPADTPRLEVGRMTGCRGHRDETRNGKVMTIQKTVIIDPLSLVSLRLKVKTNGQDLSTATGFVVNAAGRNFLITNWHVVSGRHPETDNPSSPQQEESRTSWK